MFKFLKGNGRLNTILQVCNKSKYVVNLNFQMMRNIFSNDVYYTFLKTNMEIYKSDKRKFCKTFLI
jgi:hypothetical protein